MGKMHPLKLYKYYLEEKQKLVNEKLTEKKFKELIKIEEKLKEFGLL